MKNEWWIFTFGANQKNAGHYVKIYGTFNDARQEMFRRHGDSWAFQYSLAEWSDHVEHMRKIGAEYLLETELQEGA